MALNMAELFSPLGAGNPDLLIATSKATLPGTTVGRFGQAAVGNHLFGIVSFSTTALVTGVALYRS